MDTIAVFKSRNEALKLQRELTRLGISSTTINTPSSLNIGCGLSVVFSAYLQSKVDGIISGGRFQSFYGFINR